MKLLSSVLIVIILITTISCRKDFATVESFGNLEFSRDTVFLDTIFTNIGSSTYNLKVYNKSDKAITIPEITLENGSNSNYRLNVDGIPGKSFEDIDILANDSIFVFVETTINFSTTPDPLYTDRILFDNGNNQQDVDLVTLVQDAVFIFPDRDPITMEIDNLTLDNELTGIQGRFLRDEELTFTNEKPYVIYGYAAVPANQTLTVEAGAQIHFHDQSGLIIDKDASLNINGTLNEKVVIEGDRLEHGFTNTSGQWGTIWMRAGSKNNEINHAQIKNAIVGIKVDGIGSISTPNLKLQNTEIYDSSSFGVLGTEANIKGHNLVIGNAGESCFHARAGGTYNFTHCTFGNYWNGSRSAPAVFIDNIFAYLDEAENIIIETRDLNAANFVNCIFEGSQNVELILAKVDDGSNFNYNINNSMIKFNDINESYIHDLNEELSELLNVNFEYELNFEDTPHYQNNILNGNADFKDTAIDSFDLIIGEHSDANNNATSTSFLNDLLGVDRSTSPDIGAYQHVIFEESTE